MPTESDHPSPAFSPLSSAQRSWRWRILIATYFAYGGYYLTRKVFTICKKTLADEFHWELGDTAHIWTSFLVAYMLGQFINSFIGRKWGPRVLLLGGLGISIACNVVFGFANSYKTFLVFMFFNGLVQASGWPGSVGAVSEWLRRRERGTIMGVWSTSYLMGNIVVKSLGGYLLGACGWRWSFWGCTLVSFAIWWLVYFWQRNRPEDVGLEPIVDQTAEDTRAVRASQEDLVTFRQYLQLALNPVILAMGASYFCIKFLRYALDSWLPAFLDVQGLDAAPASYYSQIFDIAGLAGAILAGWALDRLFKGNWALLCFLMALGSIVGYAAVIHVGARPIAVAFCFGLVGFMIYGPDTLLCGAASVQVAGARNGVAVAGIVNGLGSIGPIVQEEIIGYLIRGDIHEGIRNTNLLALGMAILLAVLMLVVMFRLRQAHKRNDMLSEGAS
ncbi:MAG: MFS transporter [Phycisphaerae bacterium]|nr:MFS transporter [Phycisphaerae bacterium]